VDLTPTPEQDAFREEIRAWLVDNLPWEYGRGLPPRFEDLSEEVAFLRTWQASLAAGGWVGVAWPASYGGRGAGPAEHFIVQEELARARAPEMVGRIGLNLAAPSSSRHAGSLASAPPTTSGASCSASPARGATWRHCAPGPIGSRVDGW
jgi:alkylation response protein AidB-like acyl-CoA dehydrogenase